VCFRLRFRSRPAASRGPGGTAAAQLCARALCACLLAALGACERESRPFRDLPVAAARTQAQVQTPLHAGPAVPSHESLSPYQENAWGLAEGKRLYSAFNCSGCHAHGGGAIGPPLMDDEWIYGYEPANIFLSIVEGRPNGMPSFRGRIPDHQVWQLVGYVQSMSGQTPIDAAPGRSDHMSARPPEMMTPYKGRRQTGHQ
jgi:cytochrome c oxidase cbb3-type subunit 3